MSARAQLAPSMIAAGTGAALRARAVVPWPTGPHSTDGTLAEPPARELSAHHPVVSVRWSWPERPVAFIADPHADADAFVASLQAADAIDPDATGPDGFDVSGRGRAMEVVVGGDCLDKGPSDLALLRALKRLIDGGARVHVLAGNHDLRLLMGLRALDGPDDPTTDHLFLRMGPKVVPLLREVFDTYIGDRDPLAGVPGEAVCRRRLYPSPDWFEAFPRVVAGRLSAAMIERELIRMRHKLESFPSACAAAGLSLRQVYAAALQCRRLFAAGAGEFGWFYRDMRLLLRRGSFLLVHAGIDDGIVDLIATQGVDGVNRQFRAQMRDDLFALYYGTLGNCLRTKYRDVDLPLTAHGVARAQHLGVHAVVHGHHNRTAGQRLVRRRGMIHVESDVTLDRNSRRQEGLSGTGAGVTLIDPAGHVDGLSVDYPDIKRFEPAAGRHHDRQRVYAA